MRDVLNKDATISGIHSYLTVTTLIILLDMAAACIQLEWNLK